MLGVHQAEIINAFRLSDIDAKVTVGVIDSVYQPPDGFAKNNNIGRRMDILPDCDSRDTTNHGGVVCRILSSCSERLEYNFYRVTQAVDGGKIWERHLINAIGYAHKRDNVDIINISAGNDHSEDGSEGCARHNQPCKVREAAEEAIYDGIAVVAAAGNDDQYDSVCCPSLLDTAISVGGFVSKCTCNPRNEGSIAIDNDLKPPLACWTNNDRVSYQFCSGDGCIPLPEYSCDKYQSVENWSGNVDPVWNKPDVFGPAASIVYGDEPEIIPATSWATPFVTAMAAEMVAAVRDRGKELPPYLIRQAINNTSEKMDSGEDMLFNAQSSLSYIYDELGLPRPNFESSETFESGADL